MNSDLEPAKSILRSFLKKISESRDSCGQASDCFNSGAEAGMSDSSSDRDPKPRQIEEAWIWVGAEPRDFSRLMRQPPSLLITRYYAEPASPIYADWENSEKEIFGRGCIIPPPGNRILIEYLLHLHSLITTMNERRAVWHKSLRSFLEYLRSDMAPDQLYPLEELLPERFEVRPGYIYRRTEGEVKKIDYQTIVRLVQDTAFPINFLAVSQILEHLADTILHGRPNSQHTATEAFGFSWLCLAVGARPLPALEQSLFSTPLSALRSTNPISDSRSEYQIQVNTLFGPAEIPVSRWLYDFLKTLPRPTDSDRIFTKSIRTLRRTLAEKGIKASKRAQGLGSISFLTFMNPSHGAFAQRYSP